MELIRTQRTTQRLRSHQPPVGVHRAAERHDRHLDHHIQGGPGHSFRDLSVRDGTDASSSASPDLIPVQRWAWAAGKRVRPEDPALDAKMKTLAADNLVHDYVSIDEFRSHSAGKTDFLGNLRAPVSYGTWVRFGSTGTNLLGEDHTRVTLEHVMPAVGSTNFTYEPFSTDVLLPGFAMTTAYEAENQARFATFGVGAVADKRQFGGESLFPKMGFGMTMLLPYLSGSGNLDDLKPGGYIGQPVQRYLKIAWGHGKDVAGIGPRLPVMEALAVAVNANQAALDPFITNLPVDGYLGDALDTPAGRALIPALRQFTEAFLAAMLSLPATDSELTARESKQLAKMPKAKSREQMLFFARWRDLHFSHAARDAAKRGVRYAGMGNEHLKYLRDEGLPPNSRAYDMSGSALAAFEALTAKRADEAKKSP